MVNRYLQHFKDVNVEIHVIQMAPLALCNFAAYDLLKKDAIVRAPEAGEEGASEEESGCVCVLDLGTDTSNLVITDGNRIIWQRPIPIGGNHFTRALTKELKLTFAKAEHLKRNATKSPDLKKILSALKPVLNDFVGEVQRSLGYFTNTHRDAQISYMIGLGNAFRLPGLQRFLEEKLQLNVRKLQKMERLAGESVMSSQVWTENILTFGVAYGLALQGLKRTRLLTNLLPNEIRVERLIRAKKPWAVASAAALLLGLFGMVAGAGLSFRAYGHPDVAAARDKATKVKEQADKNDKAFTSIKFQADREKKNVESIVSGQTEYLNWLALMRYVGDCVPQPDGSNLPKEKRIRDEYWDKMPVADGGQKRSDAMSGKMAYAEFKNRLGGLRQAPIAPAPAPGTGPMPNRPGAGVATLSTNPDEDLGRGIDDLIQVNVEAIDGRYYDDLKAFWDSARVKQGDVSGAVNFTDPAKGLWAQAPAPTGKGWVIEVRGYTFHHRERFFIQDTFIKNLVAKGMPAFVAGGGKPTAPAAPPGPGTPPNQPNQPNQPKPSTPPNQPGNTPPAGPGAAEKNPPAGQPDVPEEMRPVVNRISHVVLYRENPQKTSDRDNFVEIGKSVLAGITVVDPAAAGGGGGPGSPPGPAPGMRPGGMRPGAGRGGPGGGGGAATGGGSRESWQPLSASLQGSGGPGGPGVAFPRPGGSGPAETSRGPSNHTRCEFVILFVWKEPVVDLNPDAGAVGGPPSGPGGPGGPGAPPPGPGGPGAAPPGPPPGQPK
jgi:hypothetical protein